MNIRINGEDSSIESDGMTILAVLEQQEVKSPEMVSVQLNGKFVSSDDFGVTVLKENDELEYLYFMSGG